MSTQNVHTEGLSLASFRRGCGSCRTRRPFGQRPKRRYILIVCEGEETEPAYFDALKERLPREMVKRVTVQGTGVNTYKLFEEAAKCIAKQERDGLPPFHEIWLVFDKDSFPDAHFNLTIKEARKRIRWYCAWSNEAFELWYILHFQRVTTPISRTAYKEMLEREIRALGESNYFYAKNDAKMFKRLEPYVVNAISRSKMNLKAQLDEHGDDWAAMNPATCVHELVERLLAYCELTDQ